MSEHETKAGVVDAIPEPPTVLARHATQTGEIQLQRRRLADQSTAYEIIADGVFLMSSQYHIGEQVLAEQTLSRVEQQVPAGRRVLIGGLGMGFTLQKTLEYRVSRVDVVEINAHVIEWNRQFFAPLNKRALCDARANLIRQDLYSFLYQAEPATYAAIILDVDNGPSWLVHARNARLYTEEALSAWSSLLVPHGVLAVWSAQAEPEFMERMNRRFRDAAEIAVPLPDAHDRPRADYIYCGTRC